MQIHNPVIIQKLKKYVLYIAIVLFFVSGIHLISVYLFNDAQSEAEKWGSISEAIIGTFPSLNPLIPSNDHNAYINKLLYRSMLEYSLDKKDFVSDIVSCNLENLLYIECVMENNILWSDGSPITPEDIKATLDIISSTKVNPIIASLLETTTIEIENDSISFTNSKRDINFLQIFLQPILPKKVIEGLDSTSVEQKFSEIWGIYSGKLILTNINQDETVGITKLTLGRNEQYFGNPLYIDFLILNLFRDEAHFLKNKTSFNVFNDKKGLIWTSIPRLDSYEYTLSQFVWIFFNSDKSGPWMREYLSKSISREDIVSKIGSSKIVASYNPFLSGEKIEKYTDRLNLESYMNERGYYKPKILLESAINAEKIMEKDSKEKIISDEVQASENKKKEVKKIIVQSDLKRIKNPSGKKYNFVSEDNILIKGSVPDGIDAVYINDYKLTWFKAGDDTFYYRLLKEYDSITEGENHYTTYFESKGKKEKIEEFVYIYYSDKEKLALIEEKFFTPKAEIEEIQESLKPKTESKKETLSTLSIKEIETLDKRLYYNAQGKTKDYILIYSLEDELNAQVIPIIQEQLRNNGIQTQARGLSLGDIAKGLREDKLEYHMMFLGINLGYFPSNIFPYLHSSQVENGYNITNFSKLSLDILLEELKGNNLSIEKRKELEEKVLEILSEENIMEILYTPKLHLLVDKNIRDFSLPAYLPDDSLRSQALLKSYLSEKKSIDFKHKSVGGFFKFLFSSL